MAEELGTFSGKSTKGPVKTKKRGVEKTKKILECVLCIQRYSLSDVESGRYHLETLVCSPCYASMQAASFSVSCFGKPSEVGKKEKGYVAEDQECQSLCPDRKVCRKLFEDPYGEN